MSELNIGKVIKALECCADDNSCYKGGCPYKSDELTACTTKMSRDALALINKLIEDNTKLANLCLEKDVTIFELSKQKEG